MTIKTDPKLLRRSLSTIIDYGINFAFNIWLVMTYGVPNGEGGYTLSNDPKDMWVIIFWFIYFPIIESIKGQTLGKMILGLRVVTKNGNSISFVQAFKRHTVDILDFFFFGIVAIIAIKNTPNHQRLGDLWAKTIVIGGEKFDCTNCRDELALTANEIIKNEFLCPTCGMTIKLNQRHQTEVE
jgi:uncharacterized RDD family membrane protein YckC